MGFICGAAGPSTVRVTDLVTPARVRSPVRLQLAVFFEEAGGLEGEGGELGDVEEVGRLEVGVACGLFGVDGVGIDGGFDRRSG